MTSSVSPNIAPNLASELEGFDVLLPGQLSSNYTGPEAIETLSAAQARSQFFSQLKQGAIANAAANLPEPIAQTIAQAQARLPLLTPPSNRDEDWRFSSLAPLLALSLDAAPIAIVSAQVETYFLTEAATRLVFIDGQFVAEFSNLGSVKGLTIGAASQLKSLDAPGANLPGADEYFTCLNSAAIADVAMVQLAENTIVAEPIHLLFLTVGAVSSPRCRIVLGANSQATIVEDYRGLGRSDNPYFCNAVTEIHLGDQAQLSHSRLQLENSGAVHIGKTVVGQAQSSLYSNIAIQLGAQFSRHNLEIHHQGEGLTSNLYGLAIVTDSLADTHSAIDYHHPNCTSDQLYKAIVAGRGRSVFNGRVTVPKAAQLTNAAQLNRNLLLSPNGRIDTKPQLEIVADNVKCSHGATVSQLEDDEIFYLQSRGIDRISAQQLLIDAFANEILDKLPIASLKANLLAQVKAIVHS
jgi:Fe-S cluster assembly protein SufD